MKSVSHYCERGRTNNEKSEKNIKYSDYDNYDTGFYNSGMDNFPKELHRREFL